MSIKPSIYAVNHVTDQFTRALGRIAQAAGSQSVTAWQPYGMATPVAPEDSRQDGQQGVPEPEPWMRPHDYERFLRHMREAHEAAHEGGQP